MFGLCLGVGGFPLGVMRGQLVLRLALGVLLELGVREQGGECSGRGGVDPDLEP